MTGTGKRAAALAAAAVVGLAAAPAAAPGSASAAAERAGRAGVAGAGWFRLDEPNTVGHLIRFGVAATTSAAGTTRGRFDFVHLRADGSLAARGWADVTCLRVTGNVALFTAVVPEGVGPVRNHAYAVKVFDGGARHDRVASVQAQNGAERPRPDCFDFDAELPGAAIRYPLLAGGFVVHGG